MKLCNKCKIIKSLDSFYKDNDKIDGKTTFCKMCKNINNSIYTKNNKQIVKDIKTKWRKNNIRQHNECNKNWRNKNPDYYNEYIKYRMQHDINFKINFLIRNRFRAAIKINAKSGRAVEYLGCNIPTFKIYLESLFKIGMAWKNWGLGSGTWQIDHIKPFCSFNLNNSNEILEVCNYKNLQPLWNEEHRVKTTQDIKLKKVI